MKPEKHGKGRRLTEEQKEEISRLRHAGVALTKVAAIVGCSNTAARRWGTAEDRACEVARDRKGVKQYRARFKARGHKLDLSAPDYNEPEFHEWLRCKAARTRYNIHQRNDCADGTITTDWLYEKYLVGECELSERAFNFNNQHRCSPEVDRVDPSGGYFPENCRVICKTLNQRRPGYNNDDAAMMAAAEESWFTEEAETQESAK